MVINYGAFAIFFIYLFFCHTYIKKCETCEKLECVGVRHVGKDYEKRMKILSFLFVELHSKNRRDSVSIIDYLAKIQFCACKVGGLLGFSFQKFYHTWTYNWIKYFSRFESFGCCLMFNKPVFATRNTAVICSSQDIFKVIYYLQPDSRRNFVHFNVWLHFGRDRFKVFLCHWKSGFKKLFGK